MLQWKRTVNEISALAQRTVSWAFRGGRKGDNARESRTRPLEPGPTRTPHGFLPVMNAASLYQRLEIEDIVKRIRQKTRFGESAFRKDCCPMIDAFAELVQLLPAASTGSHSQPGGMLIHALETCDIALHLRQGELLPRGVATEELHRREHRWTYAVLVASLLHDSGNLLSHFRVDFVGTGGRDGRWNPLAGSLSEYAALCYRVFWLGTDRFLTSSGDRLPIAFLTKVVSQPALRWLADDSELMEELIAFLIGANRNGAIARLVLRGHEESMFRHRPQMQPSRSNPATAGETDCAAPDHAPQADLFEEENSAEEQHAGGDVASAVQANVSSGLRITSPVTLSPLVRKALDQLETEMNRPGDCKCHADEFGLFVALEEFQRRGLDSATAVRCLEAAGMLHGPDRRDKLHTRTFDGREFRGVILRWEWLEGPKVEVK